MATNYPTFQSDPRVNSLTASAGISSLLGIFTDNISISNPNFFASMELGSPYGAHIDLKKPYSDDYDIRLISDNNIESGGYLLGKGGAILSLSGSNVGIGTYSPTSKLHVEGTITIGTSTNTYQAGVLGFTDANFGFLYRPPRVGGVAAHNFEAYDGTDLLTITNGGNVGIGATNPARPLQIGNETGQQIARIAGGNAGTSGGSAIYFGAGASDIFAIGHYSAIMGGTYNDAFTLFTNAKNTILSPAGGNVGIGTSAPASKLDVRGGIINNSSDGSTDARIQFVQTNGANVPYSWIGQPSWSKTTLYVFGPTTNGSEMAAYYGSGTWQFLTNNVDRMRIQPNGNVGIGTTDPISQLDVYGAGQTTANFSTSTALGGSIYLRDSGGAPGNGGAMVFGALQGAFAGIKGYITNGGNNTTGDLTFATRRNATDSTLTEAMRITNSGNVGIGTTSPTQKLQVGDGTGQQFIRVAGADSGTNNGSAILFGAGTSGTNVYAIGHYSSIYGGAYDETMTLWTGGRNMSLAPSGGNVGVGTATPDAKLTVNGAIKLNAQGVGEGGEIQLARAGDNAIKWAIDVIGSTDSTSNLRFVDNTGSAVMLLNTSTKAVEVYSGIKFPATQVPSADVNTLDDYEEGSWTPALTGTITNFSYNIQQGRYTKIGNKVFIEGSMNLSSTGSSTGTQIRIGNLPFSSTSNFGGGGGAKSSNFNAAFSGFMYLMNDPNTTVMYLYKQSSGGTTVVPIGDFTNSAVIQFFAQYTVT